MPQNKNKNKNKNRNMKRIFIIILAINSFLCSGQDASDIIIPSGFAALTFVAANMEIKEVAKEISQFRSKEFIINNLIGEVNEKDVKFETESLASDDSGGLISVAFNCSELNKRGLLLAFFGNNRDINGNMGLAYGFRYVPLSEAQSLLNRIDAVKEKHEKYLHSNSDVNNVYLEHNDIKFVLYYDSSDKIRVFWNGFEVIWERTAFDRTKRRLNRWFE